MKPRRYEYLEFRRLLRRNGYFYRRTRGSHFVFENESGDIVSINKNLNPMVAQRLIKEHDLQEV